MKQMKVCSKCHLELPIDRFTVTNAAKGYRRGHCKTCESARVRAYYAANPDYRSRCAANSTKQAKSNPMRHAIWRRRSDLKRRFGITPDQYDQLLAAQGRACALCGAEDHGRVHYNGKPPRLPGGLESNWPIDHDHKTGHVRGLLCHTCNTQLGGYETLLERIGEAKLLEYLARPSPILALPSAPEPAPSAEYRYVAELPPRYTRGKCRVCGADQHAGGLCFKHYMRARRNGGDPGPVEDLPHAGGSLTADDVRAIRAASAEYGITTKLAAQYGVSVSLISKIRKGTARRAVLQEVA